MISGLSVDKYRIYASLIKKRKKLSRVYVIAIVFQMYLTVLTLSLLNLLLMIKTYIYIYLSIYLSIYLYIYKYKFGGRVCLGIKCSMLW